MPYVPYYPGGWQNTPSTATPINAAALQNIEDGIGAATGLVPSGDTTGAADRAAIQALLNLTGRALLSSGTFWIDQTLQITSGTLLQGAGMVATTIKAKNSFAATQVGTNPGMVMICTAGNTAANHIAVTDLTLDGNQANIASVPAYTDPWLCSPLGIRNVTGLAIERVEVINAIGYSIFPWACADVRIRGCRILSGQAATGYNQQDGIHITDVTGASVTGCWIDTGTAANGGDDAICIQGVTTGSSDVAITGNIIPRSGAHGISLVLGGAAVTRVAITGNTICSTANEGLLAPFYTTYVADANYLITNVNICGNVLKDIAVSGSGSGITLQDAYGGTGGHAGTPGYKGFTIIGNVLNGFTNASGFGIYAQQGSSLTISDNTITGWAALRGIQIGDNSAATSRPVAAAAVSGNSIDMSATAATSPMGICVVDSPDAVITGNAITGPGYGTAGSTGINLLSIGTAITGAVINNNRVRGWATRISETNNGAAPNYNTYIGNNCRDAGGTAISIAGANDVPAAASLATLNVT